MMMKTKRIMEKTVEEDDIKIRRSVQRRGWRRRRRWWCAMADLMMVVDSILRMEYCKESVCVSIWQIDVWNTKYIIMCNFALILRGRVWSYLKP
jgi:hypothetical protein